MVADPHLLEVLKDGAVAAVELVEQQRQHPLVGWRAWDCALPALSQRRAFQQLGERETCFFGGNRSGKTVLARVLAVCFALGGDHPAVKMLLKANGITWRIPDGPGQVFMVALNSDASREYHREEIAALLPAGAQRWYNRGGKGSAWVEITVPGYERKAKIWFKSCDAGRKAMQGSSVRLVVFDEEPPKDVYAEAKMRILDQAGRMVLSMTPLLGQTWVFHELATTPDTKRKRCHTLDSLDNPWLPPEEAREIFEGLSEAEMEARQKGLFVVLKGRIYTTFLRSVHVVEPFDIPDDWPRYRGIDFGTRNPFCCLWAAMSPDDQLVIYREYYLEETTIPVHVGNITAYPETVVRTWADQEDAGMLLQLKKDKRIKRVVKAKKDVRVGIDKVKRRLAARGGRVGLLIFNTCTRLVTEFENYQWLPETQRGADPKDKPLKKDDHGMDALRYIVMGVDRPKVGVAA